MQIREYHHGDFIRLKELHSKSGLDYELPNPDSPLMLLRNVVTDGEVQAAAFARKTVEVYLIVNREWRTPAWRLRAIGELAKEMECGAKKLGLEDAWCWLPSQLEKTFGRRLLASGWQKQDWRTYSRRVE